MIRLYTLRDVFVLTPQFQTFYSFDTLHKHEQDA
jgi:hypothetical protein